MDLNETSQINETCPQYNFVYVTVTGLEYYAPPVIVIVGLFGNILTFLAMVKGSNRKKSTCFYMASLAIADSFVLFLYLMLWMLTYFTANLFNEWVCKIRKYLIMVGFRVSSWIIVVMSVERALVTVYPLKACRWCTLKTAMISVSVTVILMLVTNIQYIYISGLTYLPNVNKWQCIFPYVNEFWSQVINVTGLLSGTILPFTGVLVSNAMIIYGIRATSSCVCTPGLVVFPFIFKQKIIN
ncbi:cysteinyl leukotriene receptor 1-like [Tubulanus polymorphus]|uniref:cysteinyl leukotriene receptor 1-like n=1 Tax=Tubulanus polymorphus TaxID=672921 RepID=UPI003DA31081